MDLLGAPFGDGLLLDLHVPDGPGPWPVVVWTRGSGWQEDDARRGADVVARHLGLHGFAVAGVDVSPSHRGVFPRQLDDMAAAMRHLREHATRYGIDATRVASMGDSSGGWAACLAGLALPPGERTDAVVALYPPTDLLAMDSQMLPGLVGVSTPGHDDPGSCESRLLGGTLPEVPDAARAASPITYAAAGAPPVLLVHGTRDESVPYAQSTTFADALGAVGADVRLVTLPGVGHGPWADVLDGSVGADGAAGDATGGATMWRPGADVPGRPVAFGWGVVVEFLSEHLGVAVRGPDRSAG
ncbi:alpha/beta hydrolase [Sanguibacter suaedae]|uniref:Alpha/beta hydrolase n=1 Tax=Sanguibacter suaedae TaxID=2795737 RepID=A0A934IC40_9MICO|nr:alpha/beta hydrolase [Sanguibacter suaedae]MBI9115657.1 alpha/beta hydrolase [Sanguibacter suaedae]